MRDSDSSASNGNIPAILKSPLLKSPQPANKPWLNSPFKNLQGRNSILDAPFKGKKASLVGKNSIVGKEEPITFKRVIDALKKVMPPPSDSQIPNRKELASNILGAIRGHDDDESSDLKKTISSVSKGADILSKTLSSSIGDTVKLIKNTMQESEDESPPPADIPDSDGATSDTVVSSTNAIEACDICDCLMKYVPKDVKDGTFVMEAQGSSPQKARVPLQRVKFGRLAGRLSKLREAKEDMKASAGSNVPVYVAAPNSIVGGPNLGVDRATRLENGVQRMMEFVDIADQVDQYVSGRTRQLITSLSALVENDGRTL
jgi:hypothetical protein